MRKLYVVFINFTAAFDKINREIMVDKLSKTGIKDKMIRLSGGKGRVKYPEKKRIPNKYNGQGRPDFRGKGVGMEKARGNGESAK